MPNPARTLRKIAESMADGDLKTSVYQLAGELEVQHNNQNNAFQGALGNAELGISDQLDVLTKMIGDLRTVCNNSLAQSQENATQIEELRGKLDELTGIVQEHDRQMRASGDDRADQ